MLSPKAKRNIFRIIPFGLIWLTFGIIYSLLERGLLGELHNYPSTGNPYSFSSTIFVTGAIEVLYFYKLFHQNSFVQKIFYKTIIYLAIIISFLLINTAIYNSVELK